eukprot:3753106-Ditylum_brightwellii.AAC.1
MLPVYPDFNIPFKVQMNASDTQLGAVISQCGIPIAFYSRKLNSIQKNNTVTEQELLQIRVYTNHKNQTYKNFKTARVIQWCMILEDDAPKLIYIPGNTNVIANILSHLDNNNGSKPSKKPDDVAIIEYFIDDKEAAVPLH